MLTTSGNSYDITQKINVGDIGLVAIPKEDRPKSGQRNLLVQVMGIDSDQLLLAPVIEDGVGPDLTVRYSVTEFVKGELSGFLL